jgi:hypothetical protein
MDLADDIQKNLEEPYLLRNSFGALMKRSHKAFLYVGKFNLYFNVHIDARLDESKLKNYLKPFQCPTYKRNYLNLTSHSGNDILKMRMAFECQAAQNKLNNTIAYKTMLYTQIRNKKQHLDLLIDPSKANFDYHFQKAFSKQINQTPRAEKLVAENTNSKQTNETTHPSSELTHKVSHNSSLDISTKPRSRKKRGFLGLAFESEVEEIENVVLNMADNVEVMQHNMILLNNQQEAIYNYTLTQFEAMNDRMTRTETRLLELYNDFNDAIDKMNQHILDIYRFQNFQTMLTTEIARTNSLQISDLIFVNSELSNLIQSLQDLASGTLSPRLIDIKTVKEICDRLNNALTRSHSDYRLQADSLIDIFTLKIKGHLVKKGQFIISVPLPMISKISEFKAFDLFTFPLQIDNNPNHSKMYTQIANMGEVLLINNHAHKILTKNEFENFCDFYPAKRAYTCHTIISTSSNRNAKACAPAIFSGNMKAILNFCESNLVLVSNFTEQIFHITNRLFLNLAIKSTKIQVTCAASPPYELILEPFDFLTIPCNCKLKANLQTIHTVFDPKCISSFDTSDAVDHYYTLNSQVLFAFGIKSLDNLNTSFEFREPYFRRTIPTVPLDIEIEKDENDLTGDDRPVAISLRQVARRIESYPHQKIQITRLGGIINRRSRSIFQSFWWTKLGVGVQVLLFIAGAVTLLIVLCCLCKKFGTGGVAAPTAGMILPTTRAQTFPEIWQNKKRFTGFGALRPYKEITYSTLSPEEIISVKFPHEQIILHVCFGIVATVLLIMIFKIMKAIIARMWCNYLFYNAATFRRQIPYPNRYDSYIFMVLCTGTHAVTVPIGRVKCLPSNLSAVLSPTFDIVNVSNTCCFIPKLHLSWQGCIYSTEPTMKIITLKSTYYLYPWQLRSIRSVMQSEDTTMLFYATHKFLPPFRLPVFNTLMQLLTAKAKQQSLLISPTRVDVRNVQMHSILTDPRTPDQGGLQNTIVSEEHTV